MKRFLIILVLLFGLLCVTKQGYAQVRSQFLRPDTTFNKQKFWIVNGSIVTIYGSALVVLNQFWYKDFPRSDFHFFNDGKEWLGMDKGGHVFSAYFQSRWSVGMYRWTGVNDKTAIWLGGMTGAFLQSSIEVLDGFSEKWGFSWWDFAANVGGSALVVSQELAWKEQRITLKISAYPHEYPDDLQARADDLFGTSALELFLKDYNAITYWASLNIHSFIRKDNSSFPEWFNIAVGYGSGGLYGGFENRWCENGDLEDCHPEDVVDRTDVQRFGQFYLSPDIDFTKIPTKKPGWKVLFNLLNVIKIPAPTLEVNTLGNVKFHPLFF